MSGPTNPPCHRGNLAPMDNELNLCGESSSTQMRKEEYLSPSGSFFWKPLLKNPACHDIRGKGEGVLNFLCLDCGLGLFENTDTSAEGGAQFRQA